MNSLKGNAEQLKGLGQQIETLAGKAPAPGKPAAPLDTSGIPGIEDVPPQAKTGDGAQAGAIPKDISGAYKITLTHAGQSMSESIRLDQKGTRVSAATLNGKYRYTGSYTASDGRFFMEDAKDEAGMELFCRTQSEGIVCTGSGWSLEKGKRVPEGALRMVPLSAGPGQGGAAPGAPKSAAGRSGLANISGRYRFTGTTKGRSMTIHYRVTQQGNKVSMHCEEYPDLTPYEGTYSQGVFTGDSTFTAGEAHVRTRVRMDFTEKNGVLTCKGHSSVTSSLTNPIETALACERIE